MWWVGLVSEGWLGPTRFLKGELVRQVSVRARVFGAVLVGVLLAGCNGEPGPEETSSETVTTTTSTESVTASPSESVTPQPSETSVLPPLPDAAKENTAEGAEAFIRYYFEVANLAHTGPHEGLVPRFASEVCESCVTMEGQVRDLLAAGQRASKPVYEVSSIEPIGGGSEGVQLFNIEVALPANEILDVDGRSVDSYDELVVSGQGGAIWEGAEWRIYELTLAS